MTADLDVAVVLFLNQFARASWTFDHLIGFVSQSHLMKGGVVTALVWWTWFGSHKDRDLVRGHIIATLVGAVMAIGVGRGLALTLPFRPRPVHDPAVDFLLPYGARAGMLDSWSSFPSDHAVLFFALAAGLWFAWRRVGSLAMLYAVVVISLPRVYLGLHYPTDILVGALIGIGIATLANWHVIRLLVARPALRWLRASPSSFYAFLFILTFQISVLFTDGRDLAGLLYTLLSAKL
jgi:undecaprenyl-diphosphatase